MGYTNWSRSAYANLKADYSKKSTNAIFKSNTTRKVADDMNPYGLSFRESRDSTAHPNSLAIGVFLDVTGSMRNIPEHLIRHKLGSLMDTLLDHGVEDPQVLFAAIGDHISDRAPLQVGQFESGTDELNHCLSSIYLEGGGGGQTMESYLLAWLVAGRHTSIDCFEKRNKKGFLFTMGDEMSWDEVDADRLKGIMGYPEASPITAKDVLAQAQRMYHVFHIHVNEASYRDDPRVMGYWRDLLGENLLILDDQNAIAEVIASTIAVIQGVKLDKVASSFDSGTAKAVKKALVNVSGGSLSQQENGIIKL
ncbi:MAG: hypothetical protein KTR30_09320 [Saprospiraceae bacterium]|nr:hypothetical protein [Saprospiraceae bacterium]